MNASKLHKHMESKHDQHRMFIQALMWKKFCSAEEVRTLHKRCHERSNTPLSDLKAFVESINSSIRPMNMAIVKGIDEITGDQYYVLINTVDNAISRLSSEYKPNELELFKKIVKLIIESNDGKVTTTLILNLSDEIDINKRDVGAIIKRFVHDGWLIMNKGTVYFSTRAIVELQHFFKEHYSEAITFCNLCKNIVFQGEVCKTCDAKIHHHCKSRYFADTERSLCPACRSSWEEV